MQLDTTLNLVSYLCQNGMKSFFFSIRYVCVCIPRNFSDFGKHVAQWSKFAMGHTDVCGCVAIVWWYWTIYYTQCMLSDANSMTWWCVFHLGKYICNFRIIWILWNCFNVKMCSFQKCTCFWVKENIWSKNFTFKIFFLWKFRKISCINISKLKITIRV